MKGKWSDLLCKIVDESDIEQPFKEMLQKALVKETFYQV